jgi:multiple sugar transport system permease protein
MKIGLTLRHLLGASITLVLCLVWIFPLFWGLSTALRPEEMTVSGFSWLPKPMTFDAFIHVFTYGDLPTFFFNSAVTSLAVTLFAVMFSLLAAYAFSQLRFSGKTMIFYLCIFAIIFPFESLVIPLYRLVFQLGLANTLTAIVLPQIASPIVLFVFKSFFDQIPREYREAAKLDGAPEWQILIKLYIPLSKNIIYAMSIITFIGAWNNFLWPFLVSSSVSTMTIPVGLTQLDEAYGIHYAQMMAAALVGGLPVAIMYLIFQRKVNSGFLATTGLKG